MNSESVKAGARAGTSRPSGLAVGAGSGAVAVGLPLGFVLTGVVCLVLGTAALVLWPDLLAGYHYNQRIIALTHLFTLGWLCSVVMGAMYQLVPVALETTLYSPRLGRWHLAQHVMGMGGMVGAFWIWDVKALGLFASLFGIGVVFFGYNLAHTLRRVPRFNVIAAAIASALFWLTVTMLFGLFLVAGKTWNLNWFNPIAQMHAHAHAGVIGFFLMMTVGVSYKLLPMFMLSQPRNSRRAWSSVLLLNAGLAGVVPSIMLQSALKPVFGLVIVAGLLIYAMELRAIVAARTRRAVEWPLRYFLTGLTLLMAVAALGLVLAWPSLPLTPFTGQLENVYGLLALLGVLSLAILGMLYKILPFLVWSSSYSREIGRRKVPALAELYWPGLHGWGYATFLAGLGVVASGAGLSSPVAVRSGAAVLAVSVGLFLVNAAVILSHFWKPRLKPLVLKSAAPRVMAGKGVFYAETHNGTRNS